MDNFQKMYIENTKNKENKKKEIKKLVNKLTLNNLEALHIRFEIVNWLRSDEPGPQAGDCKGWYPVLRVSGIVNESCSDKTARPIQNQKPVPSISVKIYDRFSV